VVQNISNRLRLVNIAATDACMIDKSNAQKLMYVDSQGCIPWQTS